MKLLLLATVVGVAVTAEAQSAVSEDIWTGVAEGVAYAAIGLEPSPPFGDGLLHVVRMDPRKARLRALAISHVGGAVRTARQWCDEFGLAAVVNAGMYDVDLRTHTGYFRVGEHVNSSRWIRGYKSILAFDPREDGAARAAIHDGAGGDWSDYGTVVQNLRLIRAPGVSVWQEIGRRWSEAAVAMSREGMILFLFSRSPYSMPDLNRRLLAQPLGIVQAMHVEGGPEASLSLRGGGLSLDLSGSYETGFNENDANQQQWPIPNVLGIEAVPGTEGARR